MPTESQLIEKIKIKLGYPVVKVELTDRMIKEQIDQALQKFIKHATGQATQETFFTIPISAGVTRYKMPAGVTEIIKYEDTNKGIGTQVNTLFTIDNYLYNQGMYDPILWPGQSNQFSLVDYHVALDFLNTLDKYLHSRYNWKYHYLTNELEVMPVPTFNDGTTYQFALIRAMLIEGTELDATEINYEYFYDKEWVIRYATALSKHILGEIRRKFENFQSIGNTGINLNGSALINEANTEIEKLEQQLIEQESWSGWGISMG